MLLSFSLKGFLKILFLLMLLHKAQFDNSMFSDNVNHNSYLF